MKLQRPCLFLVIFFWASFLTTNIAFGDQPFVTIDAPGTVVKGSEVTIRLTVAHSANNIFHHVDWVEVKINLRQVVWSEYSLFHLPEGAVFTMEVKYTVKENTEIQAEASCNIHGSMGPTFFKIRVRE
jgi:desulfoferrodoxin (superoxide reductase-like protein)